MSKLRVEQILFDNNVQFTGSGYQIKNLIDPVLPQDAATKAYVDNIVAGLDPKASVEAIFVGDVTTIPGYSYNNGAGGVGATLTFTAVPVIDGVTLTTGDRVIINSSTDTFVNGIYEYTNSTTLTRTSDFDGSPSSEVDGGEYAFVLRGTTYADTGWVVSSPNSTATIGTTPIVWTQFSGLPNVTASNGLIKIGSDIQLDIIGLNTGVIDSSDYVVFADVSDSNIEKRVTVSQLLSNYVNSITVDGGPVNTSSGSISILGGDAISVIETSTGVIQVNTLYDGYTIKINSAGQLYVDTSLFGDITGVNAGPGLSGGGTTGSVTLSLNVDGTTININSSGQAEVGLITVSNISNFSEEVQDVIGNILTDSSTIDFTYNDTLNQITAAVKNNSIDKSHLNTTNTGALGQVLALGNASGQFTWVNMPVNTTPRRFRYTGFQLSPVSTGSGVIVTQVFGPYIPSVANKFPEVYVNGLRVVVGSSGEESFTDCWFAQPSAPGTAIDFASLDGSEDLVWSADNSGYGIDTNDVVMVYFDSL